ncbi:hypothetical protein SAMN05444008_104153 [Cnuella takakiae]|uniref:Uncharacterized protein n=1 Tax=Cnuella takakiae TaxID=1302690 RepID=A0A1M4Y4V7_9BACT|nr:hypothetical protein [Cnuella takakiae]OLY93048.1 hypothetical protein BUE76_14945 [Cnuella takakiae]SHF00709.1 hypothetical protein SAMN05444008_104153 [Cnuella takakiae]
MTLTKWIWTPAKLIMLFGIMLWSVVVHANEGSKKAGSSIIPSYAAVYQKLQQDDVTGQDAGYHSVDHHRSYTFQHNFERKRKTRFLLRQLQQHQAVRKSSNKPFNFAIPPAADPDHEPAPDDEWHTRPPYYVFLFRLSPF